MFSPGRQESSLQVEHLDSMVGLIGDVQPIVMGHDHPAGVTKFTSDGAGFSPLVKQLSRRTIDRNAIGVDGFAPDRSWKMAEIGISRLVQRDAARVWQDGKVTQALTLAIESLHPIVVVVRHQDLIRRINGDPDRKMKLAGFGSLFSPRQQKSCRRKLGLGGREQDTWFVIRLESITAAANRATFLRRRASLRAAQPVLLANARNIEIAVAISLNLVYRSRKPCGGGTTHRPACVICVRPIFEEI